MEINAVYFENIVDPKPNGKQTCNGKQTTDVHSSRWQAGSQLGQTNPNEK
jgi:hypothetical protein